ncbi:MAG: hydrolase [Pseudomonadales bacterium]|nr:hydrolase [Pseudomonadales bacterium]
MTSKSQNNSNLAFKPSPFLKNRHVQTLWAPLFRRSPKIERWRERITLSDGDFVDLDWAGPTRGPIVMILHGLTGSSDSLYAMGLQDALKQQGVRSFVMNFRGCSGEPNLRPRIYHSGETDDAKEVFSLMHARYPNTNFAAVGYSLGGNVLLKWLGETSGKPEMPNLKAAVAVSVPYELGTTSTAMDQGFSKVYRNKLLGELKQLMYRKKRLFQRTNSEFRTTYDKLGSFKKLKTFTQFDDQVVAPLHGFTNADDYYTQCSSRQFIANIQIPTLLIHSTDDPLMQPEVVPTAEELSEQVTHEFYTHGGHVGFVAGSPVRPFYWLEKRIPAYLAPYLKKGNTNLENHCLNTHA